MHDCNTLDARFNVYLRVHRNNSLLFILIFFCISHIWHITNLIYIIILLITAFVKVVNNVL